MKNRIRNLVISSALFVLAVLIVYVFKVNSLPKNADVVSEITTEAVCESAEPENTAAVTDALQTLHEIKVRDGEEMTVSGVIEANDDGVPYRFIPDSPISIVYDDCALEYDRLYFFDDDELAFRTGSACLYDGNTYPFDVSAHIGHRCTVKASLLNFRGGGSIFLNYPIIDCLECDDESSIAADPFEVTAEDNYAGLFIVELCEYMYENYIQYDADIEWWQKPRLRFDPPNYYRIGEITSDNYQSELERAQKVCDGLVARYRLNKLENSRCRLKTGIYIDPQFMMYFCYQD